MSQPTQQQQQAPPVDHGAQLAAALQDAVKKMQPQQAAPQQPQMSQAQIDQMLRKPQLTQAHIDALFGDAATPETRMGNLMQIIQMAADHATALADLRAQQYFHEYHQSVAPMLQEAQYLGEQRFYDETYQGHDGLRQFDPFVKQMLPQLKQAQDWPADRSRQPEYLRTKVLEMVRAQNPQFDPTGGKQTQQQQSAPNLFGQQLHGQTQQPAQNRYHNSPPPPNSLAGGGSGGASTHDAPPSGAAPSLSQILSGN